MGDKSCIIDTPGFCDTNGPEIDIINQVYVSKIMKGCKNITPILIISYRSLTESRGEKLIDDIQVI